MDQDSSTLARWVLVLIAACVYNTHVLAAGPKIAFHIPAGQAQQTLLEFYQQSQVRVLYLTDTVKGVATNAVVGEMEASDALAQMLRGTQLTYEFVGDYAAVIKLAATTAMPHATSTSSPGDGPHVPPTAHADSEIKLQNILITGSLIHGVLDIVSPLIVVDKSEIRKPAYATVQDVVRALPLASGIDKGEIIPSGGVGNYNLGAGIDLRGLGSGATLVLVNGRRQPVSGLRGDFVDVSNIPWSMVDRIEVLPDGGSALYGSDAIAGVVNIILRQQLEGAETQVRYGTAKDGAAELMLAQLFGHTWDNGHWFAGYQYSDQTPLQAADRSYSANGDKRPLGGRDFRSVDSNPGNILNPQTLQPAFAIPAGQDGTSLTPGDLLPGVVNYRNQFADSQLLPDIHTHNFYLTGSQMLSEHLELFAEGRYGRRDVHQQPWISEEGQIVVPSTNPFFVNPFPGVPVVVMAYDVLKDTGPATIDGHTQDYLGTVGLKSKLAPAWQTSLSVSYGRESLDTTSRGLFDPTTLNAALADPNPVTAFNPFGDGSHTNPATIAAIRRVQQYKVRSEIPSIQFVADGPLFELPAGATKAAIGTEYREEKFDFESQGANSNPQDVSHMQLGRTITAAFTEVSVPLVGDAIDPHAVPRLELSLAGRYEHYNDFGDTFNPKLGLQWAPLRSLKLRASWDTSFKAPNLVDLSDVGNLSGIVSLSDPRSPSGRSYTLVLQGGNPDLKEERAITWTAGLDLAPQALPGFQLSVTGYSIDYKDQVIQPGLSNPFSILLHEDQWAAVITRNPSQAQIDAICSSPQFFGNPARCRTTPPTVLLDGRKHNLASTQVTGLDFTLNQALDTNYGHFKAGVDGAYVFHFDRAFTNTAPVANITNTVNNPLKLRLRGTLDWRQYGEQQSGFGATLTVSYAGSYQDQDSPIQHSVSAWTTFDLGLSYRTEGRGSWTDDTQLMLNVVNVTNEDPPFVDREWGYDVFNAQPLGRVISATLSKHW